MCTSGLKLCHLQDGTLRCYYRVVNDVDVVTLHVCVVDDVDGLFSLVDVFDQGHLFEHHLRSFNVEIRQFEACSWISVQSERQLPCFCKKDMLLIKRTFAFA